MQYDRFVVATQPRNLAEDVSTHTAISVQFVVDVDPRSVNASTLYVTTGSGVLVPSEITYDRRIATITPKEPLHAGTVYLVHVQGCTSPSVADGIVSVLGEPLVGSYSFRFKTQMLPEIESPIPTAPANAALVRDVPTFTWEEVEGAEGYKVELSSTPNFFRLIWSTKTAETSVHPAVELEDGAYYWRVFALLGGRQSQPSPVQIFTLEKEEAVEEPWLDEEMAFEGGGAANLEVKVLEPKEFPISTETKRIVLQVPVPPELIDMDSFRLHGEGVFNDPAIPSHGEVEIESIDVTAAPGGARVTIELADVPGEQP